MPGHLGQTELHFTVHAVNKGIKRTDVGLIGGFDFTVIWLSSMQGVPASGVGPWGRGRDGETALALGESL